MGCHAIEMITETGPYEDFGTAAGEVLKTLNALYPMEAWVLTRAVEDALGNEWVVLQAEDNGFGVYPGDGLCFEDNACYRTSTGVAPAVGAADDPQAIPVYREQPTREPLAVRSYLSCPITNADQSLFGSLCAINPLSVSEEVSASALPTIQTLARTLGALLNREREVDRRHKSEDWAAAQLDTDALTGLSNRRAWLKALECEQRRADRYGDLLGVLLADIDGLSQVNAASGIAAGDAVINRAAGVIQQAVGTQGLAARLGGGEFAVLVDATNAAHLQMIEQRVRRALDRHQIPASVGRALRATQDETQTLIEEADKALYADKVVRHEADAVDPLRGWATRLVPKGGS